MEYLINKESGNIKLVYNEKEGHKDDPFGIRIHNKDSADCHGIWLTKDEAMQVASHMYDMIKLRE